jgi:hypothetical protein
MAAAVVAPAVAAGVEDIVAAAVLEVEDIVVAEVMDINYDR